MALVITTTKGGLNPVPIMLMMKRTKDINILIQENKGLGRYDFERVLPSLL